MAITKAKKSRAQLEAEVVILRRSNRWSAIAAMFQTLVRSAAGVGIAYWTYATAAVLAGQSTTANILLSVLANVKVSQALLAVFGLGGITYGLRQRQLRKKAIERLEGRPRELEQMRDPGRTSSQLTRRGETPVGEDI